MIFGANPTYLYGDVFKQKFSTPDKTYEIEPLPVSCTMFPARLTGDHLEIFFAGPTFNTYVLSEEERICILRSYDDKMTICKTKLSLKRLHTVRIIHEDEKLREVELYEFNNLFPGYRSTGTIELRDSNTYISTPECRGVLKLQNNVHKPITDCLLYKIENGNYYFVEINNPIERCTVTVVKDLKVNKIVENGNIHGILLDCKSNKHEIDVFVKRESLGTYVFIEDIKEGIATVDLIEKRGKVYRVGYKGFIGECVDKNVNKTMKGMIYDIIGNSFKFKRFEQNKGDVVEKIANGNNTEIKTEKCSSSIKDKAMSNQADEENLSENKKQKTNNKKTSDFQEVVITKQFKIESEEQIENDQFKAIEYIKNKMKDTKNILPLFNKYISLLEKKDHLSIFYLQHLHEKNIFTISEFSRIMKLSSPNFYKIAVESFSDKDTLEHIYKKKKTKACFIKLLDLAEDKIDFIKKHSSDYSDYAIDYAYKNLKNPRLTVESIIGSNYGGWMAYIRNESGDYKRGLFRRVIQLSFSKEEMKNIFKQWMEFEESTGGNIIEVKQQAENYITNSSKKPQI